MKTTLLLALLAVGGATLLAPTSTALSCIENVDVDPTVDTSDDITVGATVTVDDDGLVRCVRGSIIRP